MPSKAQVPVKAKKPAATKTALKPAPVPVKAAPALEALKAAKTAKAAPKVAPKTQTAAPAKVATKAVGKRTPGDGVPSKVVKAKVKVKGTPKEAKPPKQKLVRDSFTFPQAEYLLLVGMKKRLLAVGNDAKKGELVRAGITLLSRLDDAALAKALGTIEKLKAGRPAK